MSRAPRATRLADVALDPRKVAEHEVHAHDAEYQVHLLAKRNRLQGKEPNQRASEAASARCARTLLSVAANAASAATCVQTQYGVVSAQPAAAKTTPHAPCHRA